MVDKNEAPLTKVPVTTPTDDECERLPDIVRLVKALKVGDVKCEQAVVVTVDYSVLRGQPTSRKPETYVLSLPAAAVLSRRLAAAVDEALYGKEPY